MAHSRRIQLALGILVSLLLASPQPTPAQDDPEPDTWVSPAGIHPDWVGGTTRVTGFDDFGAEVIVGKLKIHWKPAADTPSPSTVTLYTSADFPGGWASLHWVKHTMAYRGSQWEVAVPVENIEIPVVYFLQIDVESKVANSPMRVCRPNSAGMDRPTRPFWPYLDGFEEELVGWFPIGDSPRPVSQPGGHTGNRAMAISIPPGKSSAAVGSTIIRSWHMTLEKAKGVRFWARLESGTATGRLTFYGDHEQPHQRISVWPIEIELTDQWQPVDMFFHELPYLPLASIDFFTLEVVSGSPVTLLIDDLQLKGAWRLPGE